MKALEKDRSRRYETASGLARDVERYLAGEPVEAGPPSAWYRLRKFARRNRVVLTTTVLVALALIAGTTVSVWQAILARRARAEALAQRDEARQAVDDMYTDVAARVAGPAGGAGADATEVLAEGPGLLPAIRRRDQHGSERFGRRRRRPIIVWRSFRRSLVGMRRRKRLIARQWHSTRSWCRARRSRRIPPRPGETAVLSGRSAQATGSERRGGATLAEWHRGV